MKKKYVFLVSFILMVALVSSVYATSNQWSWFDKKDGNLVIIEDEIVVLPSEGDKQEAISFIDPITGFPTENISVKLFDDKITTESKTIRFKHDNKDYDLEFDYFINVQNQPVILPKFDHEPLREYSVLKIPNSQKFILEHNYSLYELDLNKSSVNKLLLDQVAGYNYDETIKIGLENERLIRWGSNPQVSLDGTKLLFNTNRGYVKGDKKSELWVKDLVNGKEYAIYSNDHISVLGLDHEYNAYIDILDGIIQINVVDRTINYIVEKAVKNVQFSYPYLVTQTSEGFIEVIDVKSGEIKEITHESLGLARSIQLLPDSHKLLIINSPDRTKLERTVMLIDLSTSDFKEVLLSDDYFVEYVQWVDNFQFIINVSRKGSFDYDSLIVNIDNINER